MFRLIPKDEKYFDLFDQLASRLEKGASEVIKLLGNGTFTRQATAPLQTLTDESETIVLSIIEKLHQSFITPIDREDIYTLAQALHTLMKHVNDIAIHLSLYASVVDIQPITDLANSLHRITQELTAAVKSVEHYELPTSHVAEVRHLTRKAMERKQAITVSLLRDSKEMQTILATKDITALFERCLEDSDRVCHVLEIIVLKHS